MYRHICLWLLVVDYGLPVLGILWAWSEWPQYTWTLILNYMYILKFLGAFSSCKLGKCGFSKYSSSFSISKQKSQENCLATVTVLKCWYLLQDCPLYKDWIILYWCKMIEPLRNMNIYTSMCLLLKYILMPMHKPVHILIHFHLPWNVLDYLFSSSWNVLLLGALGVNSCFAFSEVLNVCTDSYKLSA